MRALVRFFIIIYLVFAVSPVLGGDSPPGAKPPLGPDMSSQARERLATCSLRTNRSPATCRQAV